MDSMVREDPKASLDLRSSSLHEFGVRGFHPFNSPFLSEWSVRENIKDPHIYGSCHFVSSVFGGFTRLTLPFSWSGQRRTDHNLDLMVRKDLEGPQIYGSH